MERKAMYETAIADAEKAGDGSKARRYKRGLKVPCPMPDNFTHQWKSVAWVAVLTW